MDSGEFQYKVFQGLLQDCYKFQDHNTDFLRFPASPLARIKRQFKDKVLATTQKAGFIRTPHSVSHVSERLTYTVKHLDEFERFYNILQDEYSKQLLIELLKFRVLGAQHVKLPSNNANFWNKYAAIDRDYLKERRTIKIWNWYLNLYQLKGIQGSLKLHAHPLNVLCTFLLEQYAYRKEQAIGQVEPGDVVIDGGGCWGDTALYFADKAGVDGRVYCSEFVLDNLNIFEQNIKLNPHLANTIKIIPKALWNKTGEMIGYSTNGPATSLDTSQKHNQQASTLSIDDLVKEENLTRVDYIKMDIEGSELRALAGAENTIRTMRPKLAISLYHKDEDFITIPEYLSGLGVPYQFYLDHFTVHREETVLFAIPQIK